METIIMVLVFAGIPLSVFTLIIVGAVYRAIQRKKIAGAAQKYLNS